MRHQIVVLLAIVTLFPLAAPALAGGWATVRLDLPPEEVVAGVPWQFGFMVLQHDVSPNSDVQPEVRAVHRETAEVVTANAEQQGATGHFVAELTLPRAGEWKWTIAPHPYAETSFEALTVLEREGTPESPRQEAAATPTAAGPMETIEMVEPGVFQPTRLEIAAGTTVTWVNRSPIAHTVTGEALTFDDSGLIDPGQSFSLTFDEPGTYSYRCAPHPGMEGLIVVS
jgi:plastocyanin